MKITVIGTGYVGLVTAACFAEMGNTVACVDKDAGKVATLQAGRVPFYEPGLEPLVVSNQREGRLRFTNVLDQALDSETFFVAVGTPLGADDSVDLSQVLTVAGELGQTLDRDAVVVCKSTVPPGTAERVHERIREGLARRSIDVRCAMASNPEFLKEGSAVDDFMRPERVIVGADSEYALEALRALYSPFMRNHDRFLVMGLRDAELTKYAANAMLATRISFMNEIAALCERLGVDIENVRHGIGSDSRIGRAFIYAGCGYGGSCFPKDVRALVNTAEQHGVDADLLKAVDTRNHQQKQLLFEKISRKFGPSLKGRVIGVWGLAYKPGTDDLRDAPSMVLIEQLLRAGARVLAYDPVAMVAARRSFPSSWFKDGLDFVGHQYEAVTGADALALVTEWKPFRNPDFDAMQRLMKQPIIFDGRNQYDPKQLRAAGFEYFGIGR
jgi:UDPglucose 6-dehydrogenase